MDASKIPTARVLMEKVPTTFSPGMNLVEAIEALAQMHVAAAPVVDEDGGFLGMLTDKDCLRIVSVSAFHRPRGGKVADFLSPVSQAEVTGTVVDDAGDPAGDVEVRLKGLTIFADPQGVFSFENISSGTFTVIWSSTVAFSSLRRMVRS